MKLENFDQVVHIDTVNVTVGQSSNVNHGLSQSSLFPAGVSADIIFAQESQYLSILDDLQRPGNDEDEVRDALSFPDDEVPRSAVGHPEVGCEGAETPVTG